jgi:hypothetical protein
MKVHLLFHLEESRTLFASTNLELVEAQREKLLNIYSIGYRYTDQAGVTRYYAEPTHFTEEVKSYEYRSEYLYIESLDLTEPETA